MFYEVELERSFFLLFMLFLVCDVLNWVNGYLEEFLYFLFVRWKFFFLEKLLWDLKLKYY